MRHPSRGRCSLIGMTTQFVPVPHGARRLQSSVKSLRLELSFTLAEVLLLLVVRL